jgi:hypothetical protein
MGGMMLAYGRLVVSAALHEVLPMHAALLQNV